MINWKDVHSPVELENFIVAFNRLPEVAQAIIKDEMSDYMDSITPQLRTLSAVRETIKPPEKKRPRRRRNTL